VTIESTLVLRGQGLKGQQTALRVGGAIVPLLAPAVTDGETRVAVADLVEALPELRTSVIGLQVVHYTQVAPGDLRPAAESAVVPVVL
jgi:hypothetical protein